ncbi:MAG: trehalose-phosphatase [Acidimicrobiales bacterium]
MTTARTVPDSLVWMSEHPEASAIFVDFDGTLAPIVKEPSTARPLPGASELLAILATRFAVVAVVSGREASVLAALLGETPGVVVEGLYGLEKIATDGTITVDAALGEAVEKWRAVVRSVGSRASESAPEGVLVENKGLTLTLHFRNNPSAEAWAVDLARNEADRFGLVVEPSRKAVELRPPVRVDKGTVVTRLVASSRCGAAAYFGDDLGDLPAFDALDQLEGTGIKVARIAVVDGESPAQVADRADVVVDGPRGAVELLNSLAENPRRRWTRGPL